MIRMRPRARPLVFLASVALALPACPKKKSASMADAGPAVSVASVAPSASVAAVVPKETSGEKPFVAPPRGNAGPAYFDTLAGLAYILEDGTTGLVKGSYEHLVVGADGRVYGAGTTATDLKFPIARIEGANAKVVAKSPEPFSALAVGNDGRIHIATIKKGVHTWDPASKTWTASDPKIELTTALAIDPTGRLWALGRTDIAYLDGTEWKPVAKPGPAVELKGFSVAFDRFFVLGFKNVYEVKSSALVALEPSYTAAAAHVAATANGLFALPDFDSKTRKRSLVLLSADGATKRIASSEEHGLIDGSGRLWAIDDGELTVRSLVDDTTTTFPVGSLPILDEVGAGFMFPQRGIVVGAGPTLPASPPVRTVTSLKGKIVLAGKPVAGGTVEICREAAYATGAVGTSPCEGKKSRLTTTTSSNGELTFNDVPIGRYDLALARDGKWAVDHLMSDLKKMTPGKAVSLGTIRYK